MLTTIIRTTILYLCVIASVRLMGKRQIGELQPTELVITILLSEIAAIPIQDNNIPLINSIIPLMLLVGFEIITSVISLKSVHFRRLTDGTPVIVINNGELEQKNLKELRITADDVISALRQKDVFNISDVEYAVMETNGNISVLLKPGKRPVTSESLNNKTTDSGLLCPVITDGKILESNFDKCAFSLERLNKELSENNIKAKDVLLMTVDKNGQIAYILKEGKQ